MTAPVPNSSSELAASEVQGPGSNAGELVFGEALEWSIDLIEDLQGRTVLDVGCGDGRTSVRLAELGATVVGIDIDRVRVNRAVHLAAERGVAEQCHFMIGRAEDLPFPCGPIDLVFSKSTAQYLQRDAAFDEYLRVMDPDGEVVLMENLPWNPLINSFRAFRWLRSRLRKETAYIESITSHVRSAEMAAFGQRFQSADVRHFHVLRVATMFLVAGKRGGMVTRRLDSLLQRADNFLVTHSPAARRLAWIVAVHARRPK